MSKIVNPFSHRLGIIRDWRSRWFAVPKKMKDSLRADILLREYLEKRLRGSYVSDILIERRPNFLRLIINTSRPGALIGRSGEGMTKLRNDLLKFMAKSKLTPTGEFKIDVLEVSQPETDARIVSYMIAEGLERRLPFRRVVKQMMEKIMANRNVRGARIGVYGRLDGAEIARGEEIKKGSIPLQTFRADVDFARERAHLPYGDIGIKVWIYRGEIFKK
jgi:small subunit ribosomal protein S3